MIKVLFELENGSQDVVVQCPLCDRHSIIHLTEGQYKRFLEYSAGFGKIQEKLFDLSPDDRELLKTGICSRCWGVM